MRYKVEGYQSDGFVSYEYKLNYLMRMLAGYDDETWNKLRGKTRQTYERAAQTLLTQWPDFLRQMNEWNTLR